MFCNKLTVPEFNKEQIAECNKCKWASGNKKWCCLFGLWIQEGGRIIKPSKKILKPRKSISKKIPLTEEIMRQDYEMVKAGIYKPGRQDNLVDLAEYLRRRMICLACNGGYRCPYYCCGIQSKLAIKNWICPDGKW